MTQWLLCFWLTVYDRGVAGSCRSTEHMEQSRSRNSRKGRWLPAAETRLASRAPNWLRSWSLSRQDKNNFVLPKLPNCNSMSPEEIFQAPVSDDAFSRIVLPPLGCRSIADGAGLVVSQSADSWLLPSFPSVQRKEIYRQAREQRQLSAKVGRLPPINTTPPPPPISTHSQSAPPPRSPRGFSYFPFLKKKTSYALRIITNPINQSPGSFSLT